MLSWSRNVSSCSDLTTCLCIYFTPVLSAKKKKRQSLVRVYTFKTPWLRLARQKKKKKGFGLISFQVTQKIFKELRIILVPFKYRNLSKILCITLDYFQLYLSYLASAAAMLYTERQKYNPSHHHKTHYITWLLGDGIYELFYECLYCPESVLLWFSADHLPYQPTYFSTYQAFSFSYLPTYYVHIYIPANLFTCLSPSLSCARNHLRTFLLTYSTYLSS